VPLFGLLDAQLTPSHALCVEYSAVKGAPVKTIVSMCGNQSAFQMPRVMKHALRSFVLVFFFAGAANAQTSSQNESLNHPMMVMPSDSATLPDAPTQAASIGPANPARTHHTGHFDNLIDPQEIAPRLSISDKVGMGLKASVSPFAVLGWIGSATYSEALNRSPNYGQSAKNYAQRLGAAAARASSEDIFSTSVMAPILHEDPRYFVEGPGHPGLHRAFYALSRVLVTRRDDGRSTINYALLSGNAIGAGLTQTYYPAGNRNFNGTATTLGISLAGSGVKYLFEEFFYKEASIAQLKRRL
jgi:hypothetical protein